jgi:hypothetical protein
MDGVYSERNSGWAYWLSDDCFIPSIQDNEGVFAVWLKPSFFPELAGKPRILMTADRFHGGSTTYIQPSPFFLVFSASNDKLMHGPSAVDSDTEFETPTYQILGYESGVNSRRRWGCYFDCGGVGGSTRLRCPRTRGAAAAHSARRTAARPAG